MKSEFQHQLSKIACITYISDNNIIAYKEAFFDENSATLCIVMEFADGGDLYMKIMHNKKMQTMFSEQEIWDCLV